MSDKKIPDGLCWWGNGECMNTQTDRTFYCKEHESVEVTPPSPQPAVPHPHCKECKWTDGFGHASECSKSGEPKLAPQTEQTSVLQDNLELKILLQSLVNEASGMLYLAEHEMRAACGNTNVNCLQRKIDAVRERLNTK